MSKRNISYVFCLLAYTIWGFSFVFSKTALQYAKPFVFVAIRFVVAFLFLNVLLLFRMQKLALKGKPVWKLALMGFLQPFVYFICETYGIAKTSASFAGVMLGLIPVAGLMFGSLFLKEKINVLQIVCVIMSVMGVALTCVGGEVIMSPVGTLLLVIAVLSAVMFSIISKSVSKLFSPFERTYVMFLLGSVLFLITAVWQTKGKLFRAVMAIRQPDFWLCILYLSIISSVGAFIALNYALGYMSVGTQTVLSNFCTVVSVLAGVIILRERFSFWQMVGIGIIIASVFLISVRKESDRTEMSHT
ncbi:MAG: DMT family transporter [Lachnospiraceae bacterium]|nr:DMT family transporter [Lachnospiraceae bacterium]